MGEDEGSGVSKNMIIETFILTCLQFSLCVNVEGFFIDAGDGPFLLFKMDHRKKRREGLC